MKEIHRKCINGKSGGEFSKPRTERNYAVWNHSNFEKTFDIWKHNRKHEITQQSL